MGQPKCRGGGKSGRTVINIRKMPSPAKSHKNIIFNYKTELPNSVFPKGAETK